MEVGREVYAGKSKRHRQLSPVDVHLGRTTAPSPPPTATTASTATPPLLCLSLRVFLRVRARGRYKDVRARVGGQELV